MTPVRRQYLQIKQRYRDAIVFFRLGDFYESFDEDAQVVSQALDIVLTSRSMGKNLRVPMAGIPAHALEPYLIRLIKGGHKVAICEQLSDPKTSRGLLERDVVRVVTPGTVLEPLLLEMKANNYLAAAVIEGELTGLAYVDITTGEFATTQLSLQELPTELHRLALVELLMPKGEALPSGCPEVTVTPLSRRSFHPEEARQRLLEHFGVVTLEHLGCDRLPLAIGAAGAIVDYLSQTQPTALVEITSLNTYSTSTYMTLDAQTRRNLELFESGRWGANPLSLLSVLDETRTPMGGRLLRKWLGQPLLDLTLLEQRQEGVAFFHANLLQRQQARDHLSHIADLERLLNRIRLNIASPREVLSLKEGLKAATALTDLLATRADGFPAWVMEMLRPCDDVVALVEKALATDGVGELGDGTVIREGFSPELDELRDTSRNTREFIASLELKEREATGIKSLKVGYNRVFGYYIEVSRSHLRQVPSQYFRRQTLVGGERFITPELKEYESLILNAGERIEELERTLYRQVCAQIGERGQTLAALAEGVAHIDVLASLAEVATRYGYVRPRLTQDDTIEIKGGRHPVVERVLPPGSFVPNDVYLSVKDTQIILLTGPNMAGKSTYIRQVALITLMAHVGSFVPADDATIGLVDRIFTRVGLQDDLLTGQSTFMVEMVETATILNQATDRSLVILDEVGRGTSTYDGLSIAHAVVEYLHNNPRSGCKTLFATHYHELTALAEVMPRIQNYTVAVSEDAGNVVFLHRIVPGQADKSYGVHVAQLAGLPRTVTNRAWEVLQNLESDSRTSPSKPRFDRNDAPLQLLLQNLDSQVVEELKRVEVSNMTPLEAINKLYQLQKMAQEEE